MMQQSPILPLPPGVIPNLQDPTSRSYQIYVAAGICLPLILFFGALRFYSKLVVLKKWGWDDGTHDGHHAFFNDTDKAFLVICAVGVVTHFAPIIGSLRLILRSSQAYPT